MSIPEINNNVSLDFFVNPLTQIWWIVQSTLPPTICLLFQMHHINSPVDFEGFLRVTGKLFDKAGRISVQFYTRNKSSTNTGLHLVDRFIHKRWIKGSVVRGFTSQYISFFSFLYVPYSIIMM